MHKKEIAIDALSNLFYTMYYVDLENNSYECLNSIPEISDFIAQYPTASEALWHMSHELPIAPQYRKLIVELADSSKWQEKLKDCNNISEEYEGGITGWSRMNVFVAERNPDGSVRSTIICVQNIDKERKTRDALSEQLHIVESLSREFLNVFLVDVPSMTTRVIKLDGYVTEGLERPSVKEYPYDALCAKYVKDRVFPDDAPELLKAMNLDMVLEKLNTTDEYIYSYRVLDKGEVHTYQFKYIFMEGSGKKKIIAGFKNIDSMVKAAKEREFLRVLSETDSLTGILNRGGGEQKTSVELNRGEKGMLCIMDVDKFKSINDTFGHNVGDKVLVGVANCLRRTFRDNDVVFRLGGDEFAVFAPGVDSEKLGRIILQRFFDRLNNLDIPEIGNRKIEVSVGAILTEDSNTKSFESLYKQADLCVYKSKRYVGSEVTFY